VRLQLRELAGDRGVPREQRFKSRLISIIIFPQGKDGRPLYNPSGKYAVRLWWNGAPRRVVVDDYLPLGRDGRWLCSFLRRRWSSG
jgi:calpain-7